MGRRRPERRRLGEVFGKVSNSTQHRIRCQTSERAERSIRQQFTQVVQQRQIVCPVLVGNDSIYYLNAAGRTDTARRTLATAFERAEFHGEAALLGHVYRIVENHDAAMSDQTLLGREGFVI